MVLAELSWIVFLETRDVVTFLKVPSGGLGAKGELMRVIPD
jgi:hypothetical protein